VTYLCVAILVRDPAQARRDAARAAEAGADLVEFRVDRLTSPPEIERAIADCPVPSIVTCRPTWEGGESELGDDDRVALLAEVAEGNASYIDLELATYPSAESLVSIPRDSRPGLIISSHDFTGRPDRLLNRVADLNEADGEVAKIVWTARTVRDNLERSSCFAFAPSRRSRCAWAKAG
jgi:3-dehydroquinate dehydratase type I